MRLRRWIMAGAVAAIAVPAGAYAYLVWTTKDSPERAELAPATARPADASAPAVPESLDGTWTVVAEGGFVGYRIRERLGPLPAPSDAVGRTEDVTGSAIIADGDITELAIVVDMTTVRSDVDGRDDQLRRTALETDRFPEARFALTEPVDLPEPTIGEVVSLRLPGDLTLHGVTNAVTIDVQARWDGPSIQVAGSAQIRRADFGISVEGIPGFRIDSSGLFEFELALVGSGSTSEPTVSTIVDNPMTRTGIMDDAPCRGDLSPALPATLTFTTYSAVGLDVWIAEPGSKPRELIDRAAGATWSPDGSHLVYATAPNTDEPPELMIVGADGSASEPLGVRDAIEPDWSPDGAQIVFTRPVAPARSEIWIVNADGRNPLRLIGGAGLDVSQPRWTPDGKAIVFTSLAEATNDDVMIAAADGSSIRPLANTEAYEYSGSIQSDRLLFVVDGTVHVASTDGADPQPVTAGPHDGDPALTSDQSTLAFVTRGNLYVGPLQSGDQTCLVVGRGVVGDVRWQPRS